MVELRLSESKAALLTEILESDLSDLRVKIARTDTEEHREELMERASLLAETIRLLTALPAPVHM